MLIEVLIFLFPFEILNVFADPLEQFDAEIDTEFDFIIDYLSSSFILQLIGTSGIGVSFIFFDEFDIFEEEFDDFTSEAMGDSIDSSTSMEIFDDLVISNFSTLLITNLLGMLPFSGGMSSSLLGIFIYSFFFFLLVNAHGMFEHGWKFFSLFFPQGTPMPMAPFIILIEMISYFARVFSLSIRLFANLMSGHTLLKILLSFTVVLLISYSLNSIISVFPIILIFTVFCLETMIAILQAYVFSLLMAIYVADIAKLH